MLWKNKYSLLSVVGAMGIIKFIFWFSLAKWSATSKKKGIPTESFAFLEPGNNAI